MNTTNINLGCLWAALDNVLWLDKVSPEYDHLSKACKQFDPNNDAKWHMYQHEVRRRYNAGK
jgi:hypothetical protein